MDGALLIVIFATSGALEALATAPHRRLGARPARPRTGDGHPCWPTTGRARRADRGPGGRRPVLVRPGERIGADGRVLDGASEVDQATITGEPLPVAKEPGDEVFAGTLNGTGALAVRVERAASDSVVARIVAMVEEASATKAPHPAVHREGRAALLASAWWPRRSRVFLVPLAVRRGPAGPRCCGP